MPDTKYTPIMHAKVNPRVYHISLRMDIPLMDIAKGATTAAPFVII